MRQSAQFVAGRLENSPPYQKSLNLAKNFRAYLGDEVREPQITIPVLPLAPQSLQGTPVVSPRPMTDSFPTATSQVPIRPPSSLVITTVAERGRLPAP